MKILWVSYIFPPYGGKEGQQGAYQVRELVRRGVDIDVLTVNPHAQSSDLDLSLLKLVPESVHIYRTDPGLLSPLRYGKGKSSRLRSRLRDLVRLASNIEWIPIAWRTLRRLPGPYDGIYSLGDPISCHVVAALAKRQFGARVLLDYGDPYALKPPRRNVSRPRLTLQRALETWCLKHANVVGMRVDANAQAYKQLFPHLMDTPFVTMYGGVDQQAFDDAPSEPSPNFALVYTGKLYDHTVGFRACLQALSLLRRRGCDIRLSIVGSVREELALYASSELVDVAECVPYQSSADTMRFQKRATVLLALGFNYPYAIPSKIAEYLAARRPILCVEQPPNIISGLVQKYQRGVSVRPDPVDIAAKLETLYQAWAKGSLSRSFELENSISEISWSRIADTILSALRDGSDHTVAQLVTRIPSCQLN